MPSFYDAYTKRTAENDQAGLRDLQHASKLVELRNVMQAQQEKQQLKSLAESAGGDLNAVIQGALRAGRPDIAAKLAPLVEAQRKAQPQPQAIGAGGLRLPTGEIVPPAARPEAPQSIGPGGLRLPTGEIVPPVAKPEPVSHPVTPVPIMRDGKRVVVDARTGRVIGEAPPPAAPERALPSPLQKQLTEGAEMSDSTERFVSSFKDEYGGYKLPIVGSGVNRWKLTFGDESGQAQWWQDYELHQSQVRNKLFGSALTAPEIAAWNKSAINPGMEQKEIRKNLARRAQLEKTGLDRLMKGAAAIYSKDQIEAFTGRTIPGSPSQDNVRRSDNDPLGIR